MVVFDPAFVAPYAAVHLVQSRRKGRMRVAAMGARHQLLARGQMQNNIDVVVVSVLHHRDFGRSAAFEIFADPRLKLVSNARAQRLAKVDLATGDLNVHGGGDNGGHGASLLRDPCSDPLMRDPSGGPVKRLKGGADASQDHETATERLRMNMGDPALNSP